MNQKMHFRNAVQAFLLARAVGCVLALFCMVSAHAANDLAGAKLRFRYNMNADDGKNYVAWESDGTKSRSTFDATTGASTSLATKSLKAFTVSGKTKIAPKGLRALLLFAASNAKAATDDALTVTQNGKQLVIQFVHRGVAYRIESDSRGDIDLETGFFFAENVAENKKGIFTLKREVLPGGKPQKPAAEESTEPAAGEQMQEAENSAAPDGSADTERKEPASDGSAGMERKEPASDGNAGMERKEPASDGSTGMERKEPAADGNAGMERKEPASDGSTGMERKEPASDGNADAADSDYTPPPYEGDATDMHNIAWENVDLQPDCADKNAAKFYKGKLRATYKDGILMLSGTLKGAEAPKEAKE